MKRLFRRNQNIKHDKSLTELRAIMGDVELNNLQLNYLRGGDEDEEIEIPLNSSSNN